MVDDLGIALLLMELFVVIAVVTITLVTYVRQVKLDDDIAFRKAALKIVLLWLVGMGLVLLLETFLEGRLTHH